MKKKNRVKPVIRHASEHPVAPPYGSIGELLEARAMRSPTAVAVAAPGRIPLSYGQLQTQIADTATALPAMGLGRRDRIALVLANGPEAATAFLALAAVATCAPLNPAYQAAEFDLYLSDLHAQALVIQAGVPSPARLAARTRGIPIIELSPCEDKPAGVFTLTSDIGLPAKPHAIAQPDDIALVLHTSGTTSRPKIVPLTGRNLCASAHHVGATLALGADDRCLNVMPLFHIHGLIAATLATLAAGASVVCTHGFDAPRFFALLDEFQPTWYTAVPTMHQAILARAPLHQDSVTRRPLRFIRSSSAALPPTVLDELEIVFGAPVVEAYGMTEAAHQMASNPLPPGVRKLGSVGPAAGPKVAIMDGDGRILEHGEIGEVVVRGANMTRGYENNEQANTSAFTGDWFRTGDQGYLDADGYLFLTGRLKELINRGGEKIAPREIEETLLEHPAVAQAVTFAIPHVRLGEEVAAAVVLRPGIVTTEYELRHFAGARLAPFKVPRRVLIVDEIPKGPTGKPQRIGLAEKLGLSALDTDEPDPDTRPDQYAPPRTASEAILAAIWADVLGLALVGIHDDFLALGGDSLLAAQIGARIRDELAVEVLLIDFFDARTVAGLAMVVEGQSSAQETDEMDLLLARLETLSDEEARRLMLDELEAGRSR